MVKIGKCFDKKREYAEAVESYKKALSLDPSNMLTLFKIGWSMYKIGTVKEGLDKMRTSVASEDGLDPSNLLKLGELLTRDGDF